MPPMPPMFTGLHVSRDSRDSRDSQRRQHNAIATILYNLSYSSLTLELALAAVSHGMNQLAGLNRTLLMARNASNDSAAGGQRNPPFSPDSSLSSSSSHSSSDNSDGITFPSYTPILFLRDEHIPMPNPANFLALSAIFGTGSIFRPNPLITGNPWLDHAARSKNASILLPSLPRIADADAIDHAQLPHYRAIRSHLGKLHPTSLSSANYAAYYTTEYDYGVTSIKTKHAQLDNWTYERRLRNRLMNTQSPHHNMNLLLNHLATAVTPFEVAARLANTGFSIAQPLVQIDSVYLQFTQRASAIAWIEHYERLRAAFKDDLFVSANNNNAQLLTSFALRSSIDSYFLPHVASLSKRFEELQKKARKASSNPSSNPSANYLSKKVKQAADSMVKQFAEQFNSFDKL